MVLIAPLAPLISMALSQSSSPLWARESSQILVTLQSLGWRLCERKRVERRATMSSSTYKKAIQGRTHKERSQP